MINGETIMLLEFACSNYKSIRKEILFSALAGSDTALKENTHEISAERILKSVVIYGPNGSGKSNFIDAIAFVQNLVRSSIHNQIGQGILYSPHKSDGFSKESTYKIQFVTQNVRFAFGFSLQNMLIADEYLYYFPNGRQTKIYERTGEAFTVGDPFKGQLNTCEAVLKPNRLLLSCAANFSSVEEIAMAYRFFCDELIVYTPSNQKHWIMDSLYQIYTNPQIKSAVLQFLAQLGTGIQDIRVLMEQSKRQTNSLQPDTIPKTARIIYDTFEVDLSEEAAGIRKLIGLLYPLIDCITNDKVLVCDDLTGSLHPALVHGLIKQFTSAQTHPSAQLIFTTHKTSLLNLSVFRRDQIWFTEIQKTDRSTELYSLAEIKNIRKLQVQVGHLHGRN